MRDVRGTAIRVVLAAMLTLGHVTGTAAQIAVSAQDGKQPELGQVPSNPQPDSVAMIDLGRYPPRVIGTVQVPVSMIGPPTMVAVARDSSYAIVTSSRKFDPADPTKFVLDDKVSVIDLANPRQPQIVQTIAAGAGASGVSINHAGTLALVASTGEGTISIYSIEAKRLTLVGKLQLDPQPGPVDVAISPDGKTALVTQRRGNAMWRLAIDGTKVSNTGISYPVGGSPFGAVFSRDGKYAYNTNLLGRLPVAGAPLPGPDAPLPVGTVTVVDLRTNRIVNTLEVGPEPEHVALSPDGKYLEVTVVNGSAAQPGTPNYSPFGLLKVFRVKGPQLTQVAEARTGRWGQGATWSIDGRTILLQATVAREIEVYRLNGKRLIQDATATLKFEGRPGSIATALDR